MNTKADLVIKSLQRELELQANECAYHLGEIKRYTEMGNMETLIPFHQNAWAAANGRLEAYRDSISMVRRLF